MVLNVGKVQKIKFGLFRNTIFIECGENGLVLEQDKQQVTLYATNGKCSSIYCEIPLGTRQELKNTQYVIIAYSADEMLLEVGERLIVVDFMDRKVAVNREGIRAAGTEIWGEDVMIPWTADHNRMFGLSGDGLEMNKRAAERFWKWLDENDAQVCQALDEGGEAAEGMKQKIGRKLKSVFPYAKEELEFHVDSGRLFFYHSDKPQLMQDAEILGEMMPEQLRERWSYTADT